MCQKIANLCPISVLRLARTISRGIQPLTLNSSKTHCFVYFVHYYLELQGIPAMEALPVFIPVTYAVLCTPLHRNHGLHICSLTCLLGEESGMFLKISIIWRQCTVADLAAHLKIPRTSIVALLFSTTALIDCIAIPCFPASAKTVLLPTSCSSQVKWPHNTLIWSSGIRMPPTDFSATVIIAVH